MIHSTLLGFASIAVVATLLTTSCSHSKPAPETRVKRYQLTGRVVAIDKANKSLTVDGDEIPGFMSAMQMPYDVKDANLLNGLAAGDKIAADIVVKEDESWLENLKVLLHAAPVKPVSTFQHELRIRA